jgi:hypothetical protein
VTAYYAFWSDTTNHFHPHFLFRVDPGDVVSASLALADGQWKLAIVDETSGVTAHFSTDDEASASFNLAEWLQEDVTDAMTGKPFPYPRLTNIRFRRLEVDSATPMYADLYSQWMSASGVNWAPSPLHRDSFALRRATVSAIGAKYLQIATGEDMATRVFVPQMAGWTAATPGPQIAAACSTFAAALRKNLHALARTRWPPRARRQIHSLIRGTRVLLTFLQSPPSPSSAKPTGVDSDMDARFNRIGPCGSPDPTRPEDPGDHTNAVDTRRLALETHLPSVSLRRWLIVFSRGLSAP